jgi:hypothetical protein
MQTASDLQGKCNSCVCCVLCHTYPEECRGTAVRSSNHCIMLLTWTAVFSIVAVGLLVPVVFSDGLCMLGLQFVGRKTGYR